MSTLVEAPPQSVTTHIYSHPDHPRHNEEYLVDAVLNRDPLAIRRFWVRINPFIDTFASDRSWADYNAARQRGRYLIERNNFESLARWNRQTRSLTQHIDFLLKEELRKELVRRRHVAQSNPLLLAAIEESIEELPAGQYWLLRKLVCERISRKRVMVMLPDCPEMKIRSFSSLGTSYGRALNRLYRVCPKKYKPIVGEFISTRKRSGRSR